MTYPWLSIDLEKIEHNSRTLVTLCREYGITVSGVTKAVCGNPDVAKAMLRGGIDSLADSRLENIHRLRAAGIGVPFILLRLPPRSGSDAVVEAVGTSLNSELSVLQVLSAAAGRRGTPSSSGSWPRRRAAGPMNCLNSPGWRTTSPRAGSRKRPTIASTCGTPGWC